MPCYAPVNVSIRRKSGVSGARGASDRLDVSCGKCLGCRSDQARQWAIRMVHESQVRFPSYFVTLTYDNEKLPDDQSVRPEHLTGFVKLLRQERERDYKKRFPQLSMAECRRRTRFSYYGVGEYGEHTRRPHYHLCLFGYDLPDLHHWRGSDLAPVWRSPLLESVWKRGYVELSTLNFNTAAYVAGYVTKKLELNLDDSSNYLERVDPVTGENWRVNPPFARMSRNPAIGLDWLKKYWTDLYPADRCVVNGQISKVPEYYDRVMVQEDTKCPDKPRHELPGISFDERREMMYELKSKRIEEFEPPTEYAVKSRAANHRAKKLNFDSKRDTL